MKFSLVICTYQRPRPLITLLQSVLDQKVYPDEIIIVDGSVDTGTKELLSDTIYKNLSYYLVEKGQRGLTRQRNFGVSKTSKDSEVIFFLDDDTLLEEDYFKHILDTYKRFPDAVGVSGYIINETDWVEAGKNYVPLRGEYYYDNWVRKEGSRFQLRRVFGLEPNVPPGIMPDFSHGYSAGFLPPTGEVYEVEMLMGGIASYKRAVFESIGFSTYFEGYGLYEDADFSLRASRLGKLFVNTAAEVEHYHDEAGRPNKFRYGKMVVRNGWYVWRVKFPRPSLKSVLKWYATSFLLTLVRLGNSIKGDKKMEAFTESLGRIYGWLSLIFNSPKVPEN